MNSKNNKDVIFGSVELDPEIFAPQNVKERITTLVDQDALDAFRKIAKQRGIKYQTLLNQLIRGFVENKITKRPSKSELTEEGVRRIVREELKKKA